MRLNYTVYSLTSLTSLKSLTFKRFNSLFLVNKVKNVLEVKNKAKSSILQWRS